MFHFNESGYSGLRHLTDWGEGMKPMTRKECVGEGGAGGRHQQRTWQFKQLLKRLPVPIPPKWSVARNCCPASCSFFNTHYMLIVYNVFAKILGR